MPNIAERLSGLGKNIPGARIKEFPMRADQIRAMAEQQSRHIESLPANFAEFQNQTRLFLQNITENGGYEQNGDALQESVARVRLALTSAIEGKRFGEDVKKSLRPLLEELNQKTGFAQTLIEEPGRSQAAG